MASTTTTTEERVLALLGQGLQPEVVAAAVGVSPSRISQLVSQPDFAAKVAELRYENLAKHNTRDNAYDSLEDVLVAKMKDLIPMMFRPSEILKAIQIINGAKRRGASTPEAIVSQQTTVNLIMPVQVIQQFTKNVDNQVVKAGEQELVTVQSASMNKLLASGKLSQTLQIEKGVTDVMPTNTGRIPDVTASA